MKSLVIVTFLLLHLSPSFSQSSTETVLLQTKRKYGRYYVELGPTEGRVYRVGPVMDPGGDGYYLYNTDTVYKQSDETYTSKKVRISAEKNKIYLDVKDIKVKRHRVDTVENVAEGYRNINNAYYLKNFFALSRTLNEQYPLNHYTFRKGFYTWDSLENKDVDPAQFRLFADARLNQIKDSISSLQERRISQTNWLIQNIPTIEYTVFKDSLEILPAEFKSYSWYFGSVVGELAKQKPEFFFRLAEDMPAARRVIFWAVEKDAALLEKLRAVENHDAIKEEFFKDRGWGKP